MEITINIVKLFCMTNAIGIKAVNGSSYIIDWGDGQSDTFTGTGKPQRHLHDYVCYPQRQQYFVKIKASPDAITGIFMRDAALIYDDIPPCGLLLLMSANAPLWNSWLCRNFPASAN